MLPAPNGVGSVPVKRGVGCGRRDEHLHARCPLQTECGQRACEEREALSMQFGSGWRAWDGAVCREGCGRRAEHLHAIPEWVARLGWGRVKRGVRAPC